MPQKYIKRSELKQGESGQAICKTYIPEIKVLAEDGSRTLNFIISTDGVDRDRDTLDVNGWDINNFIKNPVVLFAHRSRDLPIAKASNIRIDNNKFKANAEFATREVFEFADTVFQLLKGKFLNATSVGFDPKEWTYNDDRGGYDFLKQELLEFSVVPVPSNPDALMTAKAAGIELRSLKKWAEQILDETDTGIWVPRKLLGEMHKQCDGKVRVYVQRKDHEDGVLFDLDGNVLRKNMKMPEQLSVENVQKLTVSAAWIDPDNTEITEGYKFLHHTEAGKVVFDLVKMSMEELLGSVDHNVSKSAHKDIYDHLCAHYVEVDVTPPDFKYVDAQVLKNLPDDFCFNDDTGNIERKNVTTIEPEPNQSDNEFDAKEIADMVVDAAKAELNKYRGKLD